MSTSEPISSSPSSLSVDQLVAFNHELEALVRAGIPLERGLLAAAGDYRGRLSRSIRELAGRLAAGERLPDAMAHSGQALPDVYRAMVEAGMRTGRLADALQGMTRIGQAVVEARRTILLACFYPLLVLTLAYVLFIGFVVEILPRISSAFAAFRFADPRMVAVLERAGPSVAIWGPAAPVALLVLVLIVGQTRRSRILDGADGLGSIIGRFPWVGRIIANYRSANFTDLLGHLVEHDVPLDQAVRLAGDAAGNLAFREVVRQFADRLAAGNLPLTAPGKQSGVFPPLIAWMIQTGHRQGELAAGLRHLATAYRRKADRQAEAFRVLLPGVLILVIGSGAVLAYGVLLFLPLRRLWDDLAIPVN